MKAQILKNTVTSLGGVKLGDVVDLPNDEFNNLLAMGRVMPYNEPVEQENRSVALEVSEVKTTKRARKKAE